MKNKGKFTKYLKEKPRLGAIAQVCNPSCLGGRDEKDYGSQPSQANIS
jgi:hypothetical protein